MADKKTEIKLKVEKKVAKDKKETEISKEVKKESKPKVEIKLNISGEAKPDSSKKVKSKPEAKQKVEIKIPTVEVKPEPKKIIKPSAFNFKVFGVWDTREVQVLDPGMKRYISLDSIYVPYTYGRNIAKQFWKSKKPIIERLANKLLASGHKGKKHWRSSGHNTGKKLLAMKIIIEAFKVIEQKTKKNPVEVFIRAIETGAPREGITTIEYSGVRYPKAVDLSPQRRIDLVLTWISQGAYQAIAAGRTVKKKIPEALAEQIMLTADNGQSFCIAKKFDLERQAAASR